jgi:hypothetical protein
MGNSKLSTNRGADDLDTFAQKVETRAPIAAISVKNDITYQETLDNVDVQTPPIEIAEPILTTLEPVEDRDMIPDDISILILEFACDSPATIFQLSLVSTRWYTLLTQVTKEPSKQAVLSATNDCHKRTNIIWKRLALLRWDVSEDINVKNWKKMYQRRKTYIDEHGDNIHLVENCEDVETNCPMEFEKLVKFFNPFDEQKVIKCSQCNKNVYKCQSREEVLEHKRQGHCVAFVEVHEIDPEILRYDPRMFRVG